MFNFLLSINNSSEANPKLPDERRRLPRLKMYTHNERAKFHFKQMYVHITFCLPQRRSIRCYKDYSDLLHAETYRNLFFCPCNGCVP